MFWEPHLCRICGLIGEASYPIFTKDFNRTLEMKLKKYLNLNVLKDDFKPKQICNRCLVKVDAFCEFVDMCYAADEKFNSILYQTQTQQGLLQQQKCYDVKEGVIVTSNDCPDLIMVVDQEMLDIVSASTNFNTPDINYGYEQTQTVLRHSGKYKTYKNASNNYETIPKDIVFVNVDRNTTSFIDENVDLSNANKNKNTANVQRHLKSVDVIKHELFKDTDEILNKNTKAVAKSSLKKHICKECSKSFARKLNLEAHMSVHTNIRPHSCDVCNKSFALKWDLTKHRRIHTDLYRCELCSKAFTVPSKLQRHIRTHTNERPFKCPESDCGRSFSDKRNLIGHRIVHTDDRKFQCDVCEKRYKTKSQLKDHKKSHTERSTFKCGICTKTYKWKTNLQLHLRKHDGYKCLHCKKDCEKLSVLIKHRKECKSDRTIA